LRAGKIQVGSCEIAMPDPIALWRAEHANFATLLDLLEVEVEHFRRGQAPDYELMLDIMFYMTHYPDALHHPKEDMAFAKIAERNPGARPVVDGLSEQHARLKRDGDALVIALGDIVNGSITTRDHVEAPAHAYISAFRGHMRTEETEILPLASRFLDRGDWAVIDAAIRKLDDPIFGKTGDERYAALRRRIAREGHVRQS